MANPIKVLQSEIADHRVPVTTLLQKVLVLATQLGDQQFVAWVRLELTGYADRDAEVEYRSLKGRYVVLTADDCTVPIQWQKSLPDMNTRFVTAPVAELESLVTPSDECFVLTIRADQQGWTSLKLRPGDRVGFEIGKATLVSFLQAIRNRILEWTLNSSIAKALERLTVSEGDNGQSVRHNEPARAVVEKTSASMTKDFAMDVLISWSKKQSREMASVFHGWLPKVVPGLRPWMSSKDIDKGKQWFGELQGFLSEATSCVICVTSENVRSPWIYYEMGAIAAKKQEVLVCPYLVGIGTSMIADGPLGQYQCTEAIKEDTLALIRSLNKALANPHDEGLLCGNFESRWPEFEQELARILGMDAVAPADFVETDADVLAGYNLSAEARRLLVTAAAGDGHVLYVKYLGGSNIQTGGNIMNEPTNRRSVAIWERALNDLVTHDLLTPRGYKGEMFEVSAKGYEVADLLQQRGGA